jgi:hypothetical protein
MRIIAFAVISTFVFQTASAQLATRLPKPSKVSQPRTGWVEAVPAEAVRTNPNAPPDYDPNLAVNDMAVSYLNLEPVRILAKSRGAYQVATTTMPVVTYWFSANSVYPLFRRRHLQSNTHW